MPNGHAACWLVANGEDGNRYYTRCDPYTDACETAFKARVRRQSGDCRNVHREYVQPVNAIPI